jgi:hypothetical protein
MTALAALRPRFSRLAASVPVAWHYDRPFRWMVIGAAVSLVVFLFRLSGPTPGDPLTPAPVPPVPSRTIPTDSTSADGPLTPPASPAPPRIAPERPLQSVIVTPAPADRFGTVPSAGRR